MCPEVDTAWLRNAFTHNINRAWRELDVGKKEEEEEDDYGCHTLDRKVCMDGQTVAKRRTASSKGLLNNASRNRITQNAISNLKISYKNYPFPNDTDVTPHRHCREELSTLSNAKHTTYADKTAANATVPPANTT